MLMVTSANLMGNKVQYFTGLHASIESAFQNANFEKLFICCEYTVHVVE